VLELKLIVRIDEMKIVIIWLLLFLPFCCAVDSLSYWNGSFFDGFESGSSF